MVTMNSLFHWSKAANFTDTYKPGFHHIFVDQEATAIKKYRHEDRDEGSADSEGYPSKKLMSSSSISSVAPRTYLH